jgi:hypothetical protein
MNHRVVGRHRSQGAAVPCRARVLVWDGAGVGLGLQQDHGQRH